MKKETMKHLIYLPTQNPWVALGPRTARSALAKSTRSSSLVDESME